MKQPISWNSNFLWEKVTNTFELNFCLAVRTNQSSVLHISVESEASLCRNHVVCPRSGLCDVDVVRFTRSDKTWSENWSGNTLLWSVFIVHVWVWPLPLRDAGQCFILKSSIIYFGQLIAMEKRTLT